VVGRVDRRAQGVEERRPPGGPPCGGRRPVPEDRPLVDLRLHACGSMAPDGWRELAHPEEGYFAVGPLSYGRAPTFLTRSGYEQVLSRGA
jgi:hypothetical protein